MNDRVREFLEQKLKPFLKKDNLILLILGGVLLLVISLPTGSRNKGTAQEGMVSGAGSPSPGSALPGATGNPAGGNGDPNSREDSWSAFYGASDSLEASRPASYEDAESLEDRYREELERELTAFLKSIDGVGDVKVMITLRASRELVVEREERTQKRITSEADSSGGTRLVEEVTQENAAIYDTSSQEKTPYVVKTVYPKVEGVVVAASGVGTGRIRTDISETVQALFGLDAHKVKVLKLGNISYETGIE